MMAYSNDIPCTQIHYIQWWRKLDLRMFNRWSFVDCTTSFVSRMRLTTVFAILSAAILSVACMSAFLGHCMKGSKMLLASGLHAFGGLVLGTSLLVFVCILTEECGNSAEMVPPSLSIFHPDYHSTSVDLKPTYSYGKSFFLAVMAFLGAEVSAVLCLVAFLNNFESDEDFVVRTLPGMERRLVEHQQLLHDHLIGCSALASDNSHEEQMLKGSFGHHIAMEANSSVDSIYGLDRRSLVTSESNNSVTGLTRGGSAGASSNATANTIVIPVMADITPGCPMEEVITPVTTSACKKVSVVPQPPECTTAPGMSTTSSFKATDCRVDTFRAMPNIYHSTTLPRHMTYGGHNGISNGENGFGSHVHMNGDIHSNAPTPTPPPPAVFSPESSQMAKAMTTMPRGGTNNSSARKKKSVTIGTFTTVETFDNNFSSAV